jgi:hypothetical protein
VRIVQNFERGFARVFKSVALNILKHIVNCSDMIVYANGNRRSCRSVAFSENIEEKKDSELYDSEVFTVLYRLQVKISCA